MGVLIQSGLHKALKDKSTLESSVTLVWCGASWRRAPKMFLMGGMDNWLPYSLPLKFFLLQGCMLILGFVRSKPTPEAGIFPFIRASFDASDVTAMLDLPSSLRFSSDRLIWQPDKYGSFSVNSAYWLAHNTDVGLSNSDSSVVFVWWSFL
ncbi:hypothetical protein ACOSP7_009736 [Xanthoceras sorbifolium]